MSKKTTSKTSKTSSRAGAKPQAPRRRTRMIALEPRMLFDGALGLDLSAQATAVAMGDASVKTDATIPPATPEAARSEPAAAAPAALPADKDVLAKPGDALAARTDSAERKEIVFVDTRVKGYEGMLAGVDPAAKVVFLAANRDGVSQIADTL